MFNQKGFSKVAVIVAVIVLIGVGYFVYNNSKKDKGIVSSDKKNIDQKIAQTKEKQILTAEEMPEELTYEENLKLQGWKTYRNEEYGFEMDIPLDWEFLGESDNKISVGADVGHNFYSSFSIATTSNSAREVIFNEIRDTYTGYEFGNTPELVEMLRISLGGEEGTKVSFYSPVGFLYEILAVEHNNITFIGEFNPSIEVSEQEKILSTFKFTK